MAALKARSPRRSRSPANVKSAAPVSKPPQAEAPLSVHPAPLSVASALAQYKYEAPRLSILERLYLDKFWNLLAARVYPPWLAPNVITMCGGLCILLAAATAGWHSPALRGECPFWVYGLNALLLFAYQSLDGSDGKQARKTHTGSPLGELMDHGVDSFTVGPIALFVADIFAYGIESRMPWIVLLGAQALFLFSNMTLFHVNCMRVNDVDVMELQTTMYFSLMLTSYYGPSLWMTHLPFGLRCNLVVDALGLDWREGVTVRDLLLVLSLFTMAINAVATCSEVLLTLRSPEFKGKQEGKAPPPCRGYLPFCRQLGFIVTYVTLAFACHTKALELLPPPRAQRALLLLLLLCSFAFAGDLMRLLASRVAHIPLPRVSRALACLAAFLVCLVQGWHSDLALATPVLIAGLSTIGFFVYMTREISSALHLHPFRVRGAKHWYSLS
jgi:phosphatidylglycerophosphate synthase